MDEPTSHCTASACPLPPELALLVDVLDLSPRPIVVFRLLEGVQNPSRTTLVEQHLNPAFKSLHNAQEELEDLKRRLCDGIVLRKKLPHRQLLDNGKWEIRVSGDYRIVLLETSVGDDTCIRSPESAINTLTLVDRQDGQTLGQAVELLPAKDWTRYSYPGMIAWVEFLRSVTWETTAIGPMNDWPSSLRQAALTMMSSPDPRLIFWGDNKAAIYNEACSRLIGTKHPEAMGQAAALSFAELWDSMKPLVEQAYNGVSTTVRHSFLPLQRDGFLEECYWDLTLLPVFHAPNQGLGCLDEFTETTTIVTGERRRQTFGYLSEQIALATTLSELWTGVLKGFQCAEVDLPWAVLYEVQNEDAEVADSAASDSPDSPAKRCVLVGTAGISEDHAEILKTFPLLQQQDPPKTNAGLVTSCRQVWRTQASMALSIADGTLPEGLAIAIPGRGLDAPVSNAQAFPVVSSNPKAVLAVVVVGLNPMCNFRGEYAVWLRSMSDFVGKASTLILLPEEQRRSRRIAEEINQALSQQLRMATMEAERSEAKFHRLAASAPTGMFMFNVEEGTIWVNDMYLEILGEPRVKNKLVQPENYWLSVVHDDDRERFEQQWQCLKERKVPITVDYRLKKPWTFIDQSTGQESVGDRWLLATAFPEIEADGKVNTIQGWITDISHRKFSEGLLAQRLEDALETKRQSENFIDMTSHEMRNPLSSILQSADSITTILDQVIPSSKDARNVPQDAVEEVIDAAQTIILCAQHQKRIVDDILTLSKLDANLLVIAPDRVSPPMLIERALKMYQGEIMRADIHASIYIEPTYEVMQIEEVILDPSRLLQVIINLLTNSIKFTQDCSDRQIEICLGASHERPSGTHHGVNFVPVRHSARPTPTPLPEWENGEDLYLQVACKDTGRGLTEDEMKLLFHRFQQASPKTYKQYGGSGLGLFISRELCELQGGQIGVGCDHGQTTFAFFVRCKRWVPGSEDNSPLSRQISSNGLAGHPSVAASPITCSRRTSVSPQPAAEQSSDHNVKGSGRPSLLGRVSSKISATLQGWSEAIEEGSNLSEQLHVLVVEDNLINQKVVSQQLRRAGCTVHVANHGIECLTFLEQTAFCSAPLPLSVVLLDLEMPVMGGIECVQQIRQRQLDGQICGHVPVIAVTANARPEQIADALEAGMDRVVTKPFRIPELMPQMATLVAEVAKE